MGMGAGSRDAEGVDTIHKLEGSGPFVWICLPCIRQCKNYNTPTTHPFKNLEKLCGLGASPRGCVCVRMCECGACKHCHRPRRDPTSVCLNGVGWGLEPASRALCPSDSRPSHSANFRDKKRQKGAGWAGGGKDTKTGWERAGEIRQQLKTVHFIKTDTSASHPTHGARVTRRGGSPAPPPG